MGGWIGFTIFLYDLVILPVYQVTLCIATKRTKHWFQIIHKWGGFDRRKKTWLVFECIIFISLYSERTRIISHLNCSFSPLNRNKLLGLDQSPIFNHTFHQHRPNVGHIWPNFLKFGFLFKPIRPNLVSFFPSHNRLWLLVTTTGRVLSPSELRLKKHLSVGRQTNMFSEHLLESETIVTF